MSRELIKDKALDELTAKLEQAGEQASSIAAQGLYVGAGMIADAITQGIEGIKTSEFEYAPDTINETSRRLPSPEEKAVLQRKGAHGISRFNNNGNEVSTIVGMANSGYGMLAGHKVPIPLIARSIESGTSFMQKQPFMRRALTRIRGKATAAIINEIDKRFRDLFGGK